MIEDDKWWLRFFFISQGSASNFALLQETLPGSARWTASPQAAPPSEGSAGRCPRCVPGCFIRFGVNAWNKMWYKPMCCNILDTIVFKKVTKGYIQAKRFCRLGPGNAPLVDLISQSGFDGFGLRYFSGFVMSCALGPQDNLVSWNMIKSDKSFMADLR